MDDATKRRLDSALTTIRQILQMPVFTSRRSLQAEASVESLPYALMQWAKDVDGGTVFSLNIWGSLADIHLAEEALEGFPARCGTLCKCVGVSTVFEGADEKAWPAYREAWRLGMTYRVWNQ